jgi:hypothetical protein
VPLSFFLFHGVVILFGCRRMLVRQPFLDSWGTSVFEGRERSAALHNTRKALRELHWSATRYDPMPVRRPWFCCSLLRVATLSESFVTPNMEAVRGITATSSAPHPIQVQETKTVKGGGSAHCLTTVVMPDKTLWCPLLGGDQSS